MGDFLPQLMQQLLPFVVAVTLASVAIRLLLSVAAPRLFGRRKAAKADPVLAALEGSAISVSPCPLWARDEGRLLGQIRRMLAEPGLRRLGLSAHARVTLGDVLTLRGAERQARIAEQALDAASLSAIVVARDGMPLIAVTYRDAEEPTYEDLIRRQACARGGVLLIEIDVDEPIDETLEKLRVSLARVRAAAEGP